MKISQSEIDNMIQELACKIQADERCFLRVVGIANNGLPISKSLAIALNLPHESVRISHYDGQILRSTPIIEGCLSQPIDNLIVDDLVKDGRTIATFAKHFGLGGNATAVLFWNPTAPKPDFYVGETDVWVVFPWDKN